MDMFKVVLYQRKETFQDNNQDSNHFHILRMKEVMA